MDSRLDFFKAYALAVQASVATNNPRPVFQPVFGEYEEDMGVERGSAREPEGVDAIYNLLRVAIRQHSRTFLPWLLNLNPLELVDDSPGQLPYPEWEYEGIIPPQGTQRHYLLDYAFEHGITGPALASIIDVYKDDGLSNLVVLKKALQTSIPGVLPLLVARGLNPNEVDDDDMELIGNVLDANDIPEFTHNVNETLTRRTRRLLSKEPDTDDEAAQIELIALRMVLDRDVSLVEDTDLGDASEDSEWDIR